MQFREWRDSDLFFLRDLFRGNVPVTEKKNQLKTSLEGPAWFWIHQMKVFFASISPLPVVAQTAEVFDGRTIFWKFEYPEKVNIHNLLTVNWKTLWQCFGLQSYMGKNLYGLYFDKAIWKKLNQCQVVFMNMAVNSCAIGTTH